MSSTTPTRALAPPPASARGRAPLLAAAAAFSAGIIVAGAAWRPTTWWLALALLAIAGALAGARRHPRIAYAVALLLMATLGALDLQLRPPRVAGDLAPYLDGNEAVFTAHVVHDGMVRERGAEQRQVVDVETETIETNGVRTPLRARIRLSIYSREARDTDDDTPAVAADTGRQFVYGERLRVTARLRPPHNYGNPGSFDYAGYLAERGIVALATASQQRVEARPGDFHEETGHALFRWRSQLRRALLARIGSLWQPREAALLSAMLLGETALLDRATRAEFQRTGVFHVLVVSGMNVALLATVVFFTLRRLRLSEILTTLATIVACAGYAFLTEGDPPVTRAAIMVAIYLATRLLYRDRAALNALGTAALLILVATPHALFEASFQLSFLAVLAIAGIALPLIQRTSAPYRSALAWMDSLAYDQSLTPRMAQFRLDLRMFAERLGRFLGAPKGTRRAMWLLIHGGRLLVNVWDTLLVSAVMQIALALPMAWYFHRAMVVGLPANILMTPLVALMVPLAALATVVALVSTKVATLLALPVAFLLDVMTRLLHALGGLRAADTRVATPAMFVVGGAALTLLFVLWAVRRNRYLALAGVVALAASAAWIAFVPAAPQVHPGVLEVTAIDVGQGDALLVVTPQGKALLVDAGGSMRGGGEFDIGEEVVSSYLWSRGITRLDAIALTHAHADHIGGLPAIIRNFRPRALWVGINPPIPAYAELLADARASGVAIEPHVAGDRFDFGGASVRIVSPPPGWQVAKSARNNDSLGMLLTFGTTSALLEGDAEKKVERLIAAGLVAAEAPHPGLLKVGHHGSATSTTPELLAAAQPAFAVISVGYRSPFGHPRGDVLERLEAAHALTHRTDVEGAITFLLDGKAVQAMPPVPR
ncbi:MAG: ComEC/Rec2 family competence protein [Candidatus Koribacter versatilis]|uniref:ComEC/Rec2 family competence protein n=1 Tax=Candidatus Korobacter versatilis TaxID=658062 RepID=A0A932A7M9_9BACT|nr:ComEC/Rec2 family competence protein [Candidatus Koribacter versatilis]